MSAARRLLGRAPFGKSARRWVLWAHVTSSSLWLGAAVAMMVVAIARDWTPRSTLEFYGFCLAVKLIDDFVIIASCGASALSGMLLSYKTPWGFFKWWWVATKLTITLLLLAVGAGYLGPWINRQELLVRGQGLAATSLPEFVFAKNAVNVLGTLQIGILAFILYLSIFKPWGKRQAKSAKVSS